MQHNKNQWTELTVTCTKVAVSPSKQGGGEIPQTAQGWLFIGKFPSSSIASEKPNGIGKLKLVLPR